MGYDVLHLSEQISVVLGLTTQRRVVIVGIGNLGHALASYSVFAERGFAVVGPGRRRPRRRRHDGGGARACSHRPRCTTWSAGRSATIGIIATPAAVAQDVCDELVAAGVVGILTFAPRR